MVRKLETPLDEETVRSLRAGERVEIFGEIFAARDAAHERMLKLLDSGEELPFDIRGAIIYYVGPTPPGPGRVIGAAGPTTSSRMDPYVPDLLGRGLRGMIGKGPRSPEVVDALAQHGAVYFAATGGAGALLSRAIVAQEVVAWGDLGPEALRRLSVRAFPAVVAADSRGGDLYRSGPKEYRARHAREKNRLGDDRCE
ncbi:MAG: Fe-S-containing hydro-lyase [Bacillota bacterium]